jgi:transcriptional regulator with XRE-family HTH domain
MTIHLEKLGRAIAAARSLAGLDQKKLATAANIPQSTISAIERGYPTSAERLKAIREVLGRRNVTLLADRRAGNYGAIGR